jgi:hypothetical protein
MLCNCVSKQRPGATKKAPLGDGAGAAQIAKKNIKLLGKGIKGLPVEEQANNVLIKTSGLSVREGEDIASTLQVFGEQFINLLQAELADSMRVALGLPMDGVEGGGCLDALAVDADEV